LYDVHPALPHCGGRFPRYSDPDGTARRWAGYIHPDAERNPAGSRDLPESYRDADPESLGDAYGNFDADRHCHTHIYLDADEDAVSHCDTHLDPNAHTDDDDACAEIATSICIYLEPRNPGADGAAEL